jgi:hypothetical protein
METTIRCFDVQVLNAYVKCETGCEAWALCGVWQPTQQAEAERQCQHLTEAGYTARVIVRHEN